MNHERGSVTILTALASGLLLASGVMAVMVVDTVSRFAHLAHAADSAALAAAREPGAVDCDAAQRMAHTYGGHRASRSGRPALRLMGAALCSRIVSSRHGSVSIRVEDGLTRMFDHACGNCEPCLRGLLLGCLHQEPVGVELLRGYLPPQEMCAVVFAAAAFSGCAVEAGTTVQVLACLLYTSPSPRD